jgi:hypothetical protein
MDTRATNWMEIAASTRARTLTAWLLAALVCGALVSGTAEAGLKGGATLSDGVAEAKKSDDDKKKVLVTDKKEKKQRGKRDIEVVHVHHHHHDDVVYVASVDVEPERPAQSELVGVQFGGAHFDRGAIRNSRSMSVRYGKTQLALDGRLSGELDVMASSVRFDSQTARGLRNGQELTVGGTLRLDLTRNHTFAGVQLIGGFRGGWLMWNYHNPIWIEDEYGDLIEAGHDDVVTYTPYAGLGFSFIRTSHFHFGADLITGFTFFESYTDQGLQNDLFKATQRTELRVGVSFIW